VRASTGICTNNKKVNKGRLGRVMDSIECGLNVGGYHPQVSNWEHWCPVDALKSHPSSITEYYSGTQVFQSLGI
jgi:hypothetical protein